MKLHQRFVADGTASTHFVILGSPFFNLFAGAAAHRGRRRVFVDEFDAGGL
jgi:hypothetical protein